MNLAKPVEFLQQKHKQFGIKTPDLHVVLGSVTAGAVSELKIQNEWTFVSEIYFKDVPEFHSATAPGHKGAFQYYKHLSTGKIVCLQAGRVHGYEGISPREAVKPVMSHRFLGTQTFILTNAAGSLQRHIPQGSVLLLKDHVNLTGLNPLVGPIPKGLDGKEIGPRFPDLTGVYDQKLRTSLRESFQRENFQINEGIYLGLMGPCFETPAETSLFGSWGLQAVGMSTVWEAISLRHSSCKVGGVSFITNLCSGLHDKPLDHFEFEKQMASSAVKFAKCLLDFSARHFEAAYA
jgi:purine-nucleoside phosphorylase